LREIGLYGCYLDTANPPPEGTQIFVKIVKGTDLFESSATVAYTQPNRGMGIKFSDVSWQFLSTLQKWVLESMLAAHD
jgi:hypothetical protein